MESIVCPLVSAEQDENLADEPNERDVLLALLVEILEDLQAIVMDDVEWVTIGIATQRVEKRRVEFEVRSVAFDGLRRHVGMFRFEVLNEIEDRLRIDLVQIGVQLEKQTNIVSMSATRRRWSYQCQIMVTENVQWTLFVVDEFL